MFWYLKVLSNYATFSGRARRKEYWMYALINFFISFGIGFTSALMKLPPAISALYTLGTILPAIAVGVRRMHDTNHSGWWMLCPFYNLVLLVLPGHSEENRFGPDPKMSGPIHNTAPINMDRAA